MKLPVMYEAMTTVEMGGISATRVTNTLRRARPWPLTRSYMETHLFL